MLVSAKLIKLLNHILSKISPAFFLIILDYSLILRFLRKYIHDLTIEMTSPASPLTIVFSCVQVRLNFVYQRAVLRWIEPHHMNLIWSIAN